MKDNLEEEVRENLNEEELEAVDGATDGITGWTTDLIGKQLPAHTSLS